LIDITNKFEPTDPGRREPIAPIRSY
jgi:AraC-like DNA-binding protein